MLHVACRMLHAACCMLHAACCLNAGLLQLGLVIVLGIGLLGLRRRGGPDVLHLLRLGLVNLLAVSLMVGVLGLPGLQHTTCNMQHAT